MLRLTIYSLWHPFFHSWLIFGVLYVYISCFIGSLSTSFTVCQIDGGEVGPDAGATPPPGIIHFGVCS